MQIEIRPVATHDEYDAVEQVQHAVWGYDDRGIVPNHLLLTAHRHGGVLLGAWDPTTNTLAGFVFSFLGRGHHGAWQQCSHMLAVLPDYREHNLGYRLKLAQRDVTLQQGVDLITWTYDPLQSRNAYLNIHKLGAICSTYLPNVYGTMRDALNRGLPSDRFEVAWQIGSAHVVERLQQPQTTSVEALQAEGVPLLNPPVLVDQLSCPPADTLPLQNDHLLVAIPADYQAIKAADMDAAHAWRAHTRALFTTAFEAGYVVTDLLPGEQHSYYLLEHRAANDEHSTTTSAT